MGRRLLIALLFALGVSGFFTFVLAKKVNAKKSAGQRVVAASRALEPGEALKPANMTLVDWPASVPLAGSSTKPDALNGRIVLYPLAPGEPILERQLAAAGSGVGLSAKIPEGMRAISLKSDEVVGVAGFLLPGTHVDVLETDRTTGANGMPVTTTVLQDVEVLAAGQKTEPDPEGKPTTVNVVTLLLKPEDAERVVLASSEGSIHFVLRNGSDRTRIAATAPVHAAAPVAGPRVVAAVVHAKAEPVSQAYVVETKMGDKTFTTSFR